VGIIVYAYKTKMGLDLYVFQIAGHNIFAQKNGILVETSKILFIGNKNVTCIH
jgi:hypothetical protein